MSKMQASTKGVIDKLGYTRAYQLLAGGDTGAALAAVAAAPPIPPQIDTFQEPSDASPDPEQPVEVDLEDEASPEELVALAAQVTAAGTTMPEDVVVEVS
jgi:hypothetical protein